VLVARVLILLLAGALAVGACGGDDDSGGSGESAATPTPLAAPACRTVPAPKPRGATKLPKPKETLDRGKTYVATVSTNCGDFQITLAAKQAPKTGGSFKYLADKGFFDGTAFHRIVPGFVIQGGDPEGNGTGGPGYSVVETPPQALTYAKGVAETDQSTEAPLQPIVISSVKVAAN
jgi:peptidyl-prolyl cis-trans isomerase B (cyclophilin B)